jgi:fructoselysine-6-P-deglycase FrlB-like protein
MTLHDEILEQPARLRQLLEGQRQRAEVIGRAVLARDIQVAFLAARGTSDNAGRYAAYLWGATKKGPVPRLPKALEPAIQPARIDLQHRACAHMASWRQLSTVG